MYIMLSTGMAFVDKAVEFNTQLFQVRPEGSSVVCCVSKRASCRVKTITEEHACMCTFALIWSFKLNFEQQGCYKSQSCMESGWGGGGALSGFF